MALSRSEGPAGLADRIDLLVAVYVAGYMALHLFVTFQPWDRYLLPLVPLVALLAARGLFLALAWLPRPGRP